MAFQDAIEPASDGAETDPSPGATSGDTGRTDRPELDPFSLEWETDRYDSIDSGQLNNVLTAAVAVANLI
jgi:hypothetical protein